MQVQQFIEITKSLQNSQEAKAFQLMLPLFGAAGTIEILSSCCELDDVRLMMIVTEGMGDAKKAHQALSQVWEGERVKQAVKDSWVDTFHITLQGDADRQYSMEVSVNLSDAGAKIWYHHVASNTRFGTPEACVDWDTLDPSDAAMWTLLISKIERLPNAWFVKAAHDCRNSLLVPLKPDDIEKEID